MCLSTDFSTVLRALQYCVRIIGPLNPTHELLVGGCCRQGSSRLGPLGERSGTWSETGPCTVWALAFHLVLGADVLEVGHLLHRVVG